MRYTVPVQLEPGAEMPRTGHPGDAGYDLYTSQQVTIEPDDSVDIPTGVRVQLPEGIWGRITGRSSALRKHGLFVNEGVIDQGFRGELFTFVTNRNDVRIIVPKGERLAQLILSPVIEADFVAVHTLAPSPRGEQGFGSTGRGTEQSLAQFAHEDIYPPTGDRPMTVYIGGPIDMATKDPDIRHRQIEYAFSGWKNPPHLYCPNCQQQKDMLADPKQVIRRNERALDVADWAVFHWTGEPTFGTPIEITRKAAHSPGRAIVVGNIGGLYWEALRDSGSVLWAAGIVEAVEAISQESGRV